MSEDRVTTSVTKVIVYPDRARVTRQGKISLETGIHSLVVEGLPGSLEPDSVRASGRGSAQAKLLSVRTARAFLTAAPREQVAQLEKRIEVLADRDQGLADKEKSLDAQITFLSSLADSTAQELGRGIALGRADVSTAQSMALYTRDSMNQACDELRKIQVQRRDMQRELDKLRNELGDLQSPKPREVYRALVEVEVGSAGELALEIMYVVPNARWTSLYDLRVDDDMSMGLSYLAEVSQHTGEDWQGVKLALSTAKPALTARLPELRPWYVRPYEPPQLQRRAAPTMAMAGLGEADMAMMADAALPEAEAEMFEMARDSAQVRQSGPALTYELRQHVDIPSDGAPHKVSVADLVPSSEMDYISAPKLASYAYRRATVTNDSALSLLPGKLNIFWAAEYVGSTQLQGAAPGQEFKVYLGVEERMRVERELVEREVDRRILGNRRRTRWAFRVKVENLTGQRAKLTLRDQIPVSLHEEIKVQITETIPSPKEAAEMGILEWELALEAGEKRQVSFAFTVEHPREMNVIGME